MTAARALEPSSPGPEGGSGPEQARRPALARAAPGPADSISPAGGNRALARALADAAASGTMGLGQAAATRTLARCPGCGGRCGATCGKDLAAPDEELLPSGQRALRRAVLARRNRVLSPRS